MELDYNLISVCGNACAGKDLLASKLVERLGYTNIKFSQPVKWLVSKFLNRELQMGVDRPLVNDISFYLKGQITKMEMLSKYNLELLTFINNWADQVESHSVPAAPFTEKFWADYTLESTDHISKKVFTDIRLPSEYRATKRLGTVFIFLDCPQEIREDRLMKRDGKIPEGIWENPFEIHMLGWDYDIRLDASVDDPELVYQEFVEKIGKLKGE